MVMVCGAAGAPPAAFVPTKCDGAAPNSAVPQRVPVTKSLQSFRHGVCWRGIGEMIERPLVLKYFGCLRNFKDVPEINKS